MSPVLVEQINKKIIGKLESVRRRTGGDSADVLRSKLAIAELNYENVLDERDYLWSTDWKPVVEEFQAEVAEALRLSCRLDVISSRRLGEILSHLNRKLSLKLQSANVETLKPSLTEEKSTNV